MDIFNRLAEYILEHHEPYRHWDRERFIDWLRWHVATRTVQPVMGANDSIAGVIIVRTVMKPEDGNDYYAHDPEGSVAFIDVIIATQPGALQLLVATALARYGHREWVAWQRGPFYVTKFQATERFINFILRRQICDQ